jgi:parallel beta-helix repeat protein
VEIRGSTGKPVRKLLGLLAIFLFVVAAGNIPASLKAVHTAIQVSPGYNIQTAIDSAPVNGIIHVPPGVYSERLMISKPLHLIGASRSDTVIDGGGLDTVIKVNSSNIEISGFTIRNALSYGQGIYLSGVSHVNITNNIINGVSNGDGVSLDGSNNDTITGNMFSGNLNAINVTNSNDNLVARNIALSNTIGVQLWNAGDNVVANNTFDNGETGINIYKGTGNIVVRNVAVKNTEIGVMLIGSSGNSVLENSLEINRFGIDIQYSPRNTFYHNNLVSSTLYQVNFVNQLDRASTVWDNGTTSCSSCVRAGNYWDDYKGIDPNGDGIGDTNLPADGVDNYPLMRPYTPLALAVRAVSNVVNGTAPLSVHFTASVVGGTAPYAYHWDFGDGATTLSADATHTYSSTGSYTAKLVVSDTAGASDQDMIAISVRVTTPPRAPSSNLILVLAPIGGGAAIVAITSAVLWKMRRSGRRPVSTHKSQK